MNKILKSHMIYIYIYITLVAVVFAFYCWMAENIPYTHDDWDWGLAIGLEQLLSANLNSRYSGNLIEVILTRVPLIKMLFMGLTFTLLPIMATELALIYKKQVEKSPVRIVLFLFFVMMCFCMPTDIWRQTYGWVAGFSNFVVSGLFVLIYIFILLKLSNGIGDEPEKIVLALMEMAYFVFGIAMQLFLENITVYVMLVSLLFPFFMRWRKRKIPRLFWPLLLGNLLGFAVMFSSDIYGSLLNTGKAVGDYRQLTFEMGGSFLEILSRLFQQFCVNILPGLTTENGLLCIFVSILVFITLFHNKWSEKKCRPWVIVCGMADLGYAIYYAYLIHLISVIYVLPDPNLLTVIANIMFICIITVQLLFAFGHDREKALWYEFIWLSSFVVLAPMVVINTIGPRSFFTSNVFIMTLCMALVAEIWTKASKYLRGALGIVIIFATLYFGKYFYAVYSDIGSTSWEREEAIRAAVTGESIELYLPAYNYSQYLWSPDPVIEERIMFFREFYSIPDNVALWCESWERMYAPPEEWHLPK